MSILLIFSFLAGVVTILSPCILPILPIVLSSSLTGGKRRPFGVVSGFIVSFTFFTLTLTLIVKATGLSADFLRTLSVVIIFLFGLSILIPKLQLLWERLASKIASKAPQSSNDKSGFWGGFVVGLSLGLIWTPCVGPIMASVLTLAATSSVTLQAVFITLAYSFGTAIPMLAIIYGGRGLLNKVPFLLKHSLGIQKVFGVILIILAVAIHFNLDRKFQAYVLTKFPEYGVGLTQLEDIDIVTQELDKLDMRSKQGRGSAMNDFIDDMLTEDGPNQCDTEFGMARSFEGGNNWLNSEELSLEDLKGQVVLVDFWTYTCINCIRTLPFVTGWYEKYKDDGLVVVGVHTPEFEFEKNTESVMDAMEDYGINYPVVQDNDYTIWRRYENRYWPAEYFVDRNGCVRRTHFGEGAYEESERFIQELLGEEFMGDTLDLEAHEFEKRTAETYLGFGRLDLSRFMSQADFTKNEVFDFFIPETLEMNQFAYGGNWIIEEERAISKDGASLEINFLAKNVYLVMRSPAGEANVKVMIDGQEISDELAGADIKNAELKVNEERLYSIFETDKTENHLLRLEFEDPDTEIYAFTFG